jgi:hypothetical protein
MVLKVLNQIFAKSPQAQPAPCRARVYHAVEWVYQSCVLHHKIIQEMQVPTKSLVEVKNECSVSQVITASWAARFVALVMMVLDADLFNLDLHIGITSFMVIEKIS